jgi:hypothetical protein
MFFSEEKNQKTFASFARTKIVAVAGRAGGSTGHKVFLLLFLQKKKKLPGVWT